MKLALIGFIASLACFSFPAFADNGEFQARPAFIEEKDAGAIPYDIFTYKVSPNANPKNIAVSKAIILSKEDVLFAVIESADSTEGKFQVVLTETGKAKFAEFTKHNIDKRLAIIGNNQILTMLMIKAPILGGKFEVALPINNSDDLPKLIQVMGLKLAAKAEIESK